MSLTMSRYCEVDQERCDIILLLKFSKSLSNDKMVLQYLRSSLNVHFHMLPIIAKDSVLDMTGFLNLPLVFTCW